jgi:hypothetical protein
VRQGQAGQKDSCVVPRPDALPIMREADGWPIVTLGRVYRAKSPEEALKRYLFGYKGHQSGTGEDCVYCHVRENYWHEPQEIQVLVLAEDTDCFF